MRCSLGREHRDDGNLDLGEIVETLLLRTLVERPAADAQAERAVERGARVGVGDADGRVVDAEADLPGQRPTGPPGFRRLATRKLQEFKRMPVGIAELEGLHASGRVWQLLWAAP